MHESETYTCEAELALYREYREAAERFRFSVETERRSYLANDAEVKVRAAENGDVFFEVLLTDAWVWDAYRRNRFVRSARIVTFRDVNVEELESRGADSAVPTEEDTGGSGKSADRLHRG